MILEKEIQQIEVRISSHRRFNKSLLSFALFLLSIAANIPGYSFPIKYHNIMLALSMVSLLAIFIAIVLSIINLVGYLKNIPLKGWKGYFGFALNLVVILVTAYNIGLMLIKIKASA